MAIIPTAAGHIQYGTVPEWIAGLATFGALVAASWAAKWAKRAANATAEAAIHARRQADVAAEQVQISREQAAAMLADMALQREHADRMHRITIEQRLDAAAPNVVARAKAGVPHAGITALVRYTGLQYVNEIPPGGYDHEAWVEIPPDGLPIPGPPVGMPYSVFSIVITIELMNVGAVAARIAFDGNDVYELTDWRHGVEMRLAPGETKTVHFERRLGAPQIVQHLLDGTFEPELDLFDLAFWVRDLGMNVRDTYRFNADLRAFRLIGAAVKAFAQPQHSWTEDVANPTLPRLYERLDADERSPAGD